MTTRPSRSVPRRGRAAAARRPAVAPAGRRLRTDPQAGPLKATLDTMGWLILVLLSVAMCAPPAPAADSWTPADTRREAAYLALHITDWGQTRNIAKNPKRFHELNPVLGEHPSVAEVDRYFIAAAAVHAAVAYALPAEWRSGFQYVTIGIEAGVTAMNCRTGIRVDF